MSEELMFGMPAKIPESTGAFELADFENLPSNTSLPPVVWSIEKHTVAQLIALSGMAKTAISRETGVPLGTINKWLQHEEFTDYINHIVLQSATSLKAKRLMILNKVLDARIEEAERLGDYSKLSKLDTLDVLAAIRKENGDEEKKEESKYIQILEKMAALSATKVIDV